MEAKVRSFFLRMKKLYLKSVKPFYVEELAGTFIFRPVGFLIALFSNSIHVTPNMLSSIKGIFGICGGILFFTGTPDSIFHGAVMLFIAQVFDFADGQLARISEKITRFGIILDGIGDGIAVMAAYLGAALALFRQNPQTGVYWWILSSAAVFCFLMHIYTQGFLRCEFYLYSCEDKTRYLPDDIQAKKIILTRLSEKMKAEKNIYLKILTAFTMFLNFSHILASKIVLIKKYRGYFDFEKRTGEINQEKMQEFRGNYKNYNGWILLLLNNVGFASNQLIFIIAGFFNRLDLAIYIILFGSNFYFLLCVIIQRISFKIQINRVVQASFK